MTTTTTIPLTELLSLNYLSNYTILYEHESPPPPSSIIDNNTLNNNNSSEVELQQLKLKSLNATKLSLLIVKAIAARDDNDNNATVNTDKLAAVDTNATSTPKRKSAYHVNNFHIKLKLPSASINVDKDCNGIKDCNDNCIVLLGVVIITPQTEETAAVGDAGADSANANKIENQPSDSRDLQNIGYTLHSIYKSDCNNDNEYDNIEPIPLTVNSSSNGISNGGLSGGNNGYPKRFSDSDITRRDEVMNGTSSSSSGISIMGNGIRNGRSSIVSNGSSSSNSGREELRMFKMRRSSQDFTLFTSLGKFVIVFCWDSI